jgi:hypothetical protein
VIIKSVRLRGRLFAAMLRGSNEDAVLMILALDRLQGWAGALRDRAPRRNPRVEPTFKEVTLMAARADIPRAPCKDRASEQSGPDLFERWSGNAASLERRHAKAG